MANIASIMGGAFVPSSQHKYVAPPEEQLRNAMIDAGITPPDEIIIDGKLRRFKSGTKGQGGHGDKTGWYVCFGDGIPAGRFGCWRAGIESTFRADIGRKLEMLEEVAIQRRIAEAKAEREAEEKRKREIAENVVDEIWISAPAANADHPYLKRKGINPNGARLTGDGRLIVPLYSEDGTLASLQYISHDGEKKYHPGGATGGKFWIVGRIEEGKKLFIAEGFATAATIYERTGIPVVVAYSASNIVHAAEIFTRLYPGRSIVVVADNDKSGVGMRYAEQASAKYGVAVVMPPIEGDANDYHLAGHDLEELLNPMGIYSKKLGVVFGDELGDDYYAPDELVEGLLTKGSSSVIYGDSNSGKTFFALALGAAISTGNDFFGRKTEQGLVIYLACEAPGSIRTRMQAIKKYYKWSLENMAIVPVPLNFYSGDGDAQSVIELVKEVEQAKGVKTALIIGDTLARIAAGANENSGEDMGPVMARFDKVAQSTGAAMAIIHHNGKNQAAGARGWSGIRAHIDTEIEVNEKDGIRSASVTKQRELPGKGDDIFFRLEVIEMGMTKFGGIATTCVAVHDDGASHEPKGKKTTKHDENIRLIEKAWDKSGMDISDGSPYISRSALKQFLIDFGYKERTAINKIDVSRNDSIISQMILSGVIAKHLDGWIVIDDLISSAMMLKKCAK